MEVVVKRTIRRVLSQRTLKLLRLPDNHNSSPAAIDIQKVVITTMVTTAAVNPDSPPTTIKGKVLRLLVRKVITRMMRMRMWTRWRRLEEGF